MHRKIASRFSSFAVVGFFALLSLEGCSPLVHPQSNQLTGSVPSHTTVGEIAFVNKEQHFVLVDLQSNLYVPPPGTLLLCVSSDGKMAHLKVGPEQKRPFVAADILDGEPVVGNEVER